MLAIYTTFFFILLYDENGSRHFSLEVECGSTCLDKSIQNHFIVYEWNETIMSVFMSGFSHTHKKKWLNTILAFLLSKKVFENIRMASVLQRSFLF